jgi:hypothetical protein
MKPAYASLKLAGPSARLIGLTLAAVLLSLPIHAQSARKQGSPISKIFFSEVRGSAQIKSGAKVEDLSQRAVYPAEGSVIETRDEGGQEKGFSTMVYSNGTGAYIDRDTRVELGRFVQEPFVPSRSDLDVEPSISHTQAFVSRGIVGLCTSKLVAGSNMTYQTPLGSVNVRGRRVVIDSKPEATRISMLEGESTVRAGAMDMGGHILQAGQQAIIRPGPVGQPNTIEIIPIPTQQLPVLEEMVGLACAAKRTVYFDVRERQDDSSDAAGAGASQGDRPVTAFDADSSITPGFADGGDREIVPVPVVPVNLPTEYTVSPATLAAPARVPPNG